MDCTTLALHVGSELKVTTWKKYATSYSPSIGQPDNPNENHSLSDNQTAQMKIQIKPIQIQIQIQKLKATRWEKYTTSYSATHYRI